MQSYASMQMCQRIPPGLGAKNLTVLYIYRLQTIFPVIAELVIHDVCLLGVILAIAIF